MPLLFSLPPYSEARSVNSQGLPPYAMTLFNQINTYRSYSGLPRLRVNKQLTRLARRHSFFMFHQNRLSHADFKTRFRQSGSSSCVENVGYNHSAPLKQFDAWRASRGHDANMLNGEMRYAGIAQVGKYVTFFACH